VQYSRKTGQEGPVRAGGQVIVRLGCGGVGGAVRWCMASWAQARCLSVCLSASEAYLWSSVGERDKHGGTSRHLPRTRELGRASPHLSPLTANCNAFSEYARSSDIMQQCPGLIRLLSGLSPHMCACHSMVLVRGTWEHVLYHLECSACSSHVVFERVDPIFTEHLTVANKTFQAKSHVFIHLRVLPASRRQDALPICLAHDKIERSY
jgi:hypothetical protein